MGQPPACGHHSQGSLQRLAHSTLPSPVGGLSGQPPVAPAVRPGDPAQGRARTPVSRAAGTACPQHALGSASETPSETPQLSVLPACQPFPACRSFLSPGLSSTVLIHAFVPVHKPGNSTLFGLAVRLQHVGLQSSHGGGIISLPISSRTYDLIRCASASATDSASFIACHSWHHHCYASG